VISVVGNVVPNTYSNMVKSALKGDFKTASALHLRTATLVDLLFAEGNPGGIKAALNAKGILGEGVRLPLVPVSTDLKKKIAKELEGIS
jgi:4-hydroxy-tetrahydrodipicolinate synthase